MNNYLIESSDLKQIKVEINNIILKEHKEFKDINITIYDLDKDSLEDVLEDLNTYGLFEQYKIIELLSLDRILKDEFKNEQKKLLKYLNDSNNNCLLFLVVSKFEKKKIYTQIKDLSKYIKIELDSKKYIKDELEGYKLDNRVISLIDEYCAGDIIKIRNECYKLKTYKIDSKEITCDDVEKLVVRKIVEDSSVGFEFVRVLAEKNVKESIRIYKELKLQGLKSEVIVGMMASQFRVLVQVKDQEDKGIYNYNDIAVKLNLNPYRVKKTKELTRLFSKIELLNIIIDLQEIDLKLKTTNLNSDVLIETFIMKLKDY